MKRILAMGLCVGLIGCSHAKTNLLISQNGINGVLNGVIEKYNPTTIIIESEGEKIGGSLSPLVSTFYGRYESEYEAGVDFGLKYSLPEFYTKGKIGSSYESKKFVGQKTHFNLHINLGIGIERQVGDYKLIFGGVFNHHSNGNRLLKNFGIDVDNEPNKGINTLGLEMGFSF